MAESLEDRLRSHAEAFNGLLSLIPAKQYYGTDTSDQWQKKKQTKEEARSAKRAKLDPDNAKSAKDVMDENARKRKREAEDGSDLERVASEKPLEGLKPAAKKAKKQKSAARQTNDIQRDQATMHETLSDPATAQKVKAEKRKMKREEKKAKAEIKAARKEARKTKQEQLDSPTDVADEPELNDEDVNPFTGDVNHIEIEGVSAIADTDRSSTATPSPRAHSPTFDAPPAQSGSSSISSIVPPTNPDEAKSKFSEGFSKKDAAASDELKQPKIPADELRARLENRINALRAARKADGLNGQPARTRQELMDARRLKEAERKAHKKELRRQAKEEEDRKHAETLARGSPLLSGSPLFSPRSGSNALNSPAEPSNSFSFGRIAFGSGQQASAQLNDVLNIRASKGPSDPATALQAVEKRQAHLASLDKAKRADIEEKDMWLNARKHAHGERVRDNTSLLKKTLKRKEKQKEKSKNEWQERLEGIKKAQGLKQKRREENLQKRKDEKGGKGKKGKGKPKQKPRPGFEGSFRARSSNSSRSKKE